MTGLTDKFYDVFLSSRTKSFVRTKTQNIKDDKSYSNHVDIEAYETLKKFSCVFTIRHLILVIK